MTSVCGAQFFDMVLGASVTNRQKLPISSTAKFGCPLDFPVNAGHSMVGSDSCLSPSPLRPASGFFFPQRKHGGLRVPV